MKKGNLPPKERKRLARLKRELNELLDKAYKMDGGEYDDEPWNDRYNSKEREVKRLELLNQ